MTFRLNFTEEVWVKSKVALYPQVTDYDVALYRQLIPFPNRFYLSKSSS